MSTDEKFDWCEYYNFAKSFDGSENPVELRNGVSRFYYSAFCICRDYLISHNYNLGASSKRKLTSKSSEVHEETRKIFSEHRMLNTSNAGNKISRELDRARIKRNKADYESNNFEFKHDYMYVKCRIKKIFNLLDDL